MILVIIHSYLRLNLFCKIDSWSVIFIVQNEEGVGGSIEITFLRHLQTKKNSDFLVKKHFRFFALLCVLKAFQFLSLGFRFAQINQKLFQQQLSKI